MRALLLVLFMSLQVYGQDFNLDNFTPIDEPAVIETVDPVEIVEVNNEDFNGIDISVLGEEDKEAENRIAEMRRIAEEIKQIAEEIRNNKVTTMTLDQSIIDSFENRISALEDKSLNYVTKENIKELIEEEVKKVVKVTMLLDGKEVVKEVPMNMVENSVVYNKVAIPGYYGTFDVPENGYIVSIDGVPVSRSNSVRYNNVVTNSSSSYYLQWQTGKSRNVRIARPLGCNANGIYN